MNRPKYKPQATYRPLSPRPIGVFGGESVITKIVKLVKRPLKAAWLYCTHRYSWNLSWVQAEK